MPLYRNIFLKKPGNKLRAVPETAVCTTAHPFDEQGMIVRPNQAIIDHTQLATSSRPASSCQGTNVTQSGDDYCTEKMSSAAKFDLELKSALSITSLKGKIGIYKHGRVQWLHDSRASSEGQTKDGLGAAKRSNPKIHLVIPSGAQDRQQPAKPFFSYSGNTQISSDPAEYDISPIVSPPCSDNKISRCDSVVSPFTNPQPIPLGRFQRSTGSNIPRSNSRIHRHYRTRSKSSISSIKLQDSNASSTYGNQSPKTSVGTESAPTGSETMENSESLSKIQPQSSRRAFDEPRSALQSDSISVDASHMASATPLRRYTHHPPIEQDLEFRPTCKIRPPRHYINSTSQSATNRQTSRKSSRRSSLASGSSMGLINQALSRSASKQPSKPSSPTLSEAENDLQEHLSSLGKDLALNKSVDGVEQQPLSLARDSSFNGDKSTDCKEAADLADQSRLNSETGVACDSQGHVQQDLHIADIIDNSPSPPLPRRSSKRQSLYNPRSVRPSHVPSAHVVNPKTRDCSHETKKGLTITIPEYKRKADELAPLPTQIAPAVVKRVIAPNVAEGVILGILQRLNDFNDLFAMAVTNTGFYRVFKRHELELIKSTLWKMSPPAWEYRQVAFPGHDSLQDNDLEIVRPQEEYTPSTYLQFQARDISTIRSIKSLIKERCQSFLRPEILIALVSQDPVEAARVDDALWRIWTFCKTFGSGKGREEDIVAQMDWLRGGLLVHQPACTFSITITDYMNDTLANAPEYFAKGNEGGLTAEQLFDMMELWNCLGVLLQGFEGYTAQAREFGIYDNTNVRGGDIDGEEMMLDEWCYYLLTFGLSTVLELAGSHIQPDSSVFNVASRNGWTSWKPPMPGSTRRNFLKEAASRVYVDKIAHVYAESSSREVQREMSKARIQKYVTEIRQRKNSGERMHTSRMIQERPMSEWDTVVNGLTRLRPTLTAENDLVSYIPSLRSAAPNSVIDQDRRMSIAELPAGSTSPPPLPPRRVVAQPLLPTPPSSTVPSTQDRSSPGTSLAPINEHPAHRGYQGILKPLPPPPPISNQPVLHSSSMLFSLPRHVQNNNHIRPAVIPQSNMHTNSNVPVFSPPRAHNDRRASIYSQGSIEGSTNSAERSAFQQHHRQQQIHQSENHINTADKAIYRIVEMGFTADQARDALRVTDLGDGLRVDRAVELLLARAM